MTFFHKYISNTKEENIMLLSSNISRNFTPAVPAAFRRGTGTGTGTVVPTGVGLRYD